MANGWAKGISGVKGFTYNRVDGLKWERPSLDQINAFHKTVEREKAPRVTLRMEKGHDIDAACGQLRLKEMKC